MNEKEKINVRPVGVIHANKDYKAHIHKVIIEECGGHEIPYVMNASTVLLYNPSLSLDELLASIGVLKRDVKLRLQKEIPAT
jgi:hypothetical protein